MTDVQTDRVLIVSNDAHVGPPLKEYRPYCPARYLDDFDDYISAIAEPAPRTGVVTPSELTPHVRAGHVETLAGLRAQALIHYDPHEALRHMDDDGVAAETFFHGCMNGHPIPFLSTVGLLNGKPFIDGARGFELAYAGMRIYNRWLADYCSVAPDRMIGLAQFPMWDVDLAVAEIEFARNAGLRGLNFPAPRPTLPDYNELVWEPVWSAAASFDMPLNTHGGSSPVVGVATYTGVDGPLCLSYESIQFSRRGVPFLLLGGVFERHPGLKLILTEQPAEWVTTTLRDLDGLWEWSQYVPSLPRKPSEYFATNCYVGVSFMSNREARTAVEQGTTHQILWGRDYPHIEGTWPYTKLSLRKAMEGVPVDAARRMLGSNAAEAYGLDARSLAPIVDRIGPTMEELKTPLVEGDIPEGGRWTMGFRESTSWS